MTKTNSNRGAWNCNFCHATNVSARCGCAASREADGRANAVEISVDDIELVIPARKGRAIVKPVTLIF